MEINSSSELNRISVRDGWAKDLAIYYWLREKMKEKGGSGWLPLTDILEIMQKIFKLGKAESLHILEKYDDILWISSKNAKTLSYSFISFSKILQHYNAQSGNMVNIDGDDLLKAKRRNATFYKTFMVDPHNPYGYKTISREALCKLFNVTVKTLISWEKEVGVSKIYQCAYAKITPEVLEQVPMRDGEYIYQRGQWTSDVDGDGEKELVWQIPNGYRQISESKPLPKRFRKGLYYVDKPKQKRYYDDPKSAYNALEKTETPLYIKTHKRSFTGGRKTKKCVLFKFVANPYAKKF